MLLLFNIILLVLYIVLISFIKKKKSKIIKPNKLENLIFLIRNRTQKKLRRKKFRIYSSLYSLLISSIDDSSVSQFSEIIAPFFYYSYLYSNKTYYQKQLTQQLLYIHTTQTKKFMLKSTIV